MTHDVEAALAQAFRGRICHVVRREFDWLLAFDERRALVLTAPWRILAEARIAFADTDHGQRFGLAEPIDGETRANELIGRRPVTSVEIRPPASDLILGFEGDVTAELFNGSSGYEAWQADFPEEGRARTVIGLGGGGTATYLR